MSNLPFGMVQLNSVIVAERVKAEIKEQEEAQLEGQKRRINARLSETNLFGSPKYKTAEEARISLVEEGYFNDYYWYTVKSPHVELCEKILQACQLCDTIWLSIDTISKIGLIKSNQFGISEVI